MSKKKIPLYGIEAQLDAERWGFAPIRTRPLKVRKRPRRTGENKALQGIRRRTDRVVRELRGRPVARFLRTRSLSVADPVTKAGPDGTFDTEVQIAPVAPRFPLQTRFTLITGAQPGNAPPLVTLTCQGWYLQAILGYRVKRDSPRFKVANLPKNEKGEPIKPPSWPTESGVEIATGWAVADRAGQAAIMMAIEAISKNLRDGGGTRTPLSSALELQSIAFRWHWSPDNTYPRRKK